MQAARAQNADEAPLTPYRPQGNRLELEIETFGDALKAQFEHCRCIPHLRPFVSLFVSDIHNLFGKLTQYVKAAGQAQVGEAVPAGSGSPGQDPVAADESDETDAVTASPYQHRFEQAPPWEEKGVPAFGRSVAYRCIAYGYDLK